MNAKYLIAVSLIAATGSAMADGLSRADVRGELEREYAAGNYTRPVVAEASVDVDTHRRTSAALPKEAAPVARTTGQKSRAEVRAELEREYLAGNYTRPVVLEAIEPAQIASTRTREEVRNEARQAAKSTQVKEDMSSGY